MRRALDVTGELTLQVANTTLNLTGQGQTVRVQAPDMASAIRALNSLPVAPATLNQLALILKGTDLTLQLVVGTEQLAEIGAGVDPSRVQRLLGLPGFRLHPWRVLLSALGLDAKA